MSARKSHKLTEAQRERKRECRREYHKKNYEKDVAFYIEHNLCTQCHKNPPDEGRRLCWVCRGYNRDYRRLQYERRKKAGLCTHCGKNPIRDGKVTCAVCIEIQTTLEKAKRREERLYV